MTKPMVREAQRLRDKGWPAAAIADRFGVSKSSILKNTKTPAWW